MGLFGKKPYWLTAYYSGEHEVLHVFGIPATIWKDAKKGKCLGIKCFNNENRPFDIDFYQLGHVDESNKQLHFYYQYFEPEFLVLRRIACNQFGNIYSCLQEKIPFWFDPHDCDECDCDVCDEDYICDEECECDDPQEDTDDECVQDCDEECDCEPVDEPAEEE